MSLLYYLLEHNRYCNVIGVVVILGIAWLFSKNRFHVNIRLIIHGLLLQIAIGYVVLKTIIGQQFVQTISGYVTALYQFADEGSRFVFGSLVDTQGPWGFIFGFKVLPVIVFFGAFMALLFHFGIVQHIVLAVNYLIRPILGTSGVETLCAIANSFLGQTEAPLLVRNYLKGVTKSEMLVVMVSGMATISGAILVVFAAMGVPIKHLLTASMMAIPSSLLISKILYPEVEKSKIDHATVELEQTASNMFDAIATGTIDGLHLALNVAAMLISFLALLALVNLCLASIASMLNTLFNYFTIGFQLPELSLGLVFSYIFLPFGYLLGFVGKDAFAAGQLIGIKVAVNEVIAYSRMIEMGLSERAINILTYALCGFSNFSCIGMQIGGIGSLVPQKRKWLTELGLYAVLGGTLANLLSAMMAGLLL